MSWHPITPDPIAKISKSCFSGRLKEWKLRLHLWGNLDEKEFQYILDNNLKLPPQALESNCKIYNKVNFERNILKQLDSNSHVDLTLENIEFLNLSISPIKFSKKDIVLEMLNLKNQFRIKGAEASKFNSNKLSQSILLPEMKIYQKFDYAAMSYPTLFISESYRSMQIWKSCNFILQCDLESSMKDNLQLLAKHKVPLSQFNFRHGINLNQVIPLTKKKGDFFQRLKKQFKNERIKKNELKKIPDFKSSLDLYRLVNRPVQIFSNSKKVVKLDGVYLLNRHKKNLQDLPCYYPSTIIYCSILNKLKII